MDSPSKRESAEARKMLKKRAAYPKSGARIVRLGFMAADSPRAFDSVVIVVFANILVFTSDIKASFRKQLAILCCA